jgi:hypothetical protein
MNQAEFTDSADTIQKKIEEMATAYGNKIVNGSYKYQLHIPRVNVRQELDEDLKPDAALWTSTASPRGRTHYTSEWRKFLSDNPYLGKYWNKKQGTLYRVLPGVKILPIFSDESAIKLASLVDVHFRRGEYRIFSDYPWEILGRWVDGIRYVPRTKRRLYNPLTSTWDVESTAWFRTNHLERIGPVQLDTTRYN